MGEHINDLNNNNHHSYKLQNDWNTYGKDNFNFQVISMLDNSISNFIDKYILLIYESKYIEEYNSIYEGYNIEKTINKVINKKKIIMDAYKDPIMISGYIEKVNNGEFKEIDGIIYKEIFIMHDILKCFDISYSKLKMLLIKNNILVVGDSNKVNSYILNEKVFNKEDIIINNGNYSKLKFSRKIYLSIIEIIKKFMEENNLYRAVSKNIYIYYKLKGFKNEMKNNLNSKCITYKMTKEEMDKYLENRFRK